MKNGVKRFKKSLTSCALELSAEFKLGLRIVCSKVSESIYITNNKTKEGIRISMHEPTSKNKDKFIGMNVVVENRQEGREKLREWVVGTLKENV